MTRMIDAAMRLLRCSIVTLLLLASAVLAQTGLAQTGPVHLAMRLAAESTTPRAGSTVTLALDTRPQAGWHGYWINPGDAGFPAKFDWTLPRGATTDAPVWPVPVTLLIAGLMNYVYEAPYAPLVSLHVPAGLAVGTPLPVKLHLQYLVCTREICVPEQQDLTLALKVGDGAVSPTVRAAFDGWRRTIPRPLDARAVYAVKDGALRIAVPYPAGAAGERPYFFPLTTSGIDYAAPQTVTRDGDRLVIATKGNAKGAIDGVLRIGRVGGLIVHTVPGTVGDAASGGVAGPALLAFLGAALGGLILNIMPCVFPILSLKALGLARGGTSERAARAEALAYTGGVVLVCLGLGATILALRSGGSAIGWAFQLQDPRAVVVLMLLSVGIALNLGGLFELPTPRFAAEGGVASAFATGALAAFVATPCTGPFMGAALGAALVLPWYVAMAVFGGLGLGLALPFLAIGFVPGLRKRLPKPGAWMDRFRRALSVPMWLTALALGWVLGRQAGVDAMTLGLGAGLVVGLMLWIGGRRQGRGLAFGLIPAALVVLATAGAALAIARVPAKAVSTQSAEAFTEPKLTALRAKGTPVFVYFTADWCLTCKVNERTSIDTAGARASFARKGVAALVGDWTDGDPVLGRFIQAHNRAGVPLYLYYPRGGGEPRVLPQVLTPGVLEALG